MENMNVADVLGTLFLIYGVIDGYRKGFVKKGILFASSILTLVIVYMASPYVAGFFREILPSAFSLENVLGTDSGIYTMLVLSGLGNEAEDYMYVMASRILAVAVTYIIVRILLRTLSFPEVFQHPVEYMAMERVIRGQGGMIEILGGIVEHPEPPHEAL